MIFPCLTKALAKYSLASLAAREGALSCMKTIFFWNAKLFFLYHSTRCSFGKSKNSLEFILTPSETLNSSTSSLPIRSPKHHTTTPPSRVARHSSVNRTFENLISCYFLPIQSSFSCGYPLMKGKPLTFHIFQSSSEYSIELIWAHQEHQHFQILLY